MFSTIFEILSTIRANSSRLAQKLPSCCPICQLPQSGSLICGCCYSSLKHSQHCCFQCAEPLPVELLQLDKDTRTIKDAHILCGQCQRSPPAFDRVITRLSYTPPLSDLIQDYKFNHQLKLLPGLADCLIKRLHQLLSDGYCLPEAIIPVPLHPKRMRYRGFNQSLLLAKAISAEFQIPIFYDSVIRTRQTSEQSTLNRKQRQINIRNAFAVKRPLLLGRRQIQKIAIVDDVITSGNTANELARILKQSDVTFIDVWCIAKTPFIK